MNNPYLDEYLKIYKRERTGDNWLDDDDLFSSAAMLSVLMFRGDRRGELVTQYAWAVPNQAAIETLVNLSPIVEMGAGTGYWAHLVKGNGGKIVPYDIFPPSTGTNSYRHKQEYTRVRVGSTEVLKRGYMRHTLFLCWPPYARDFALECLQDFQGRRFVYVGEGEGGCNGTDEFFELLRKEWREVKQINIPQWSGLHDYMRVFHRNRRKRGRS